MTFEERIVTTDSGGTELSVRQNSVGLAVVATFTDGSSIEYFADFDQMLWLYNLQMFTTALTYCSAPDVALTTELPALPRISSEPFKPRTPISVEAGMLKLLITKYGRARDGKPIVIKLWLFGGIHARIDLSNESARKFALDLEELISPIENKVYFSRCINSPNAAHPRFESWFARDLAMHDWDSILYALEEAIPGLEKLKLREILSAVETPKNLLVTPTQEFTKLSVQFIELLRSMSNRSKGDSANAERLLELVGELYEAQRSGVDPIADEYPLCVLTSGIGPANYPHLKITSREQRLVFQLVFEDGRHTEYSAPLQLYDNVLMIGALRAILTANSIEYSGQFGYIEEAYGKDVSFGVKWLRGPGEERIARVWFSVFGTIWRRFDVTEAQIDLLVSQLSSLMHTLVSTIKPSKSEMPLELHSFLIGLLVAGRIRDFYWALVYIFELKGSEDLFECINSVYRPMHIEHPEGQVGSELLEKLSGLLIKVEGIDKRQTNYGIEIQSVIRELYLCLSSEVAS